MGGALGRAAPRILIGDCIDMATTAENPLATDAKMLQSYLGGKWQAGAERGAPLVNPCDGTVLAWASSEGLDLRAALDYSRNVGGRSCASWLMRSARSCWGKLPTCWPRAAISGTR